MAQEALKRRYGRTTGTLRGSLRKEIQEGGALSAQIQDARAYCMQHVLGYAAGVAVVLFLLGLVVLAIRELTLRGELLACTVQVVWGLIMLSALCASVFLLCFTKSLWLLFLSWIVIIVAWELTKAPVTAVVARRVKHLSIKAMMCTILIVQIVTVIISSTIPDYGVICTTLALGTLASWCGGGLAWLCKFRRQVFAVMLTTHICASAIALVPIVLWKVPRYKGSHTAHVAESNCVQTTNAPSRVGVNQP